MSIRVLIADDHPVVRDGLRFSIERSGRGIDVVAEAADGTDVLKAAATTPVDVFVLDITMPRLNGLETAREVLKRYPAARVIMLSFHGTSAFVEQAMEAGALGYLTKETASRNIVDAVCQVHAGGLYLGPDVAHFIVDKAMRRGATPRPARAAALTAQERKILQLIAEGLTSKEIAANLNVSANTVHVHRRNLMAKLNLHKATDLARFAIKEGIAKL